MIDDDNLKVLSEPVSAPDIADLIRKQLRVNIEHATRTLRRHRSGWGWQHMKIEKEVTGVRVDEEEVLLIEEKS